MRRRHHTEPEWSQNHDRGTLEGHRWTVLDILLDVRQVVYHLAVLGQVGMTLEYAAVEARLESVHHFGHVVVSPGQLKGDRSNCVVLS